MTLKPALQSGDRPQSKSGLCPEVGRALHFRLRIRLPNAIYHRIPGKVLDGSPSPGLEYRNDEKEPQMNQPTEKSRWNGLISADTWRH